MGLKVIVPGQLPNALSVEPVVPCRCLCVLYQRPCPPLAAGCLCVYSSSASFEYLRQSVEKTLLSSLQEEEGRPPFQGLPLVLVLAADSQLPRAELAQLRQDGRSLADK